MWLTLLLVGRDVAAGHDAARAAPARLRPLPVHFLGKAATFNLLYAFPLLLLGEWDNDVGSVAHALGWAFAIWGTALYWWAGVLYLVQVRDRSLRQRAGGGGRVKAVVMAGGEGTRLRPMTASMPKPLLPVVNKPIMEHVLRLLTRHGFDETVVTVQFLASLVRNYFGDGEELGMRLHYATEETPLGTAGSVKNAEHLLRDDTFLVISRRRAHRLRPHRPGRSSTTTRAPSSRSA